MAHPLVGAYARIDRADTHFKELESLLQWFSDAERNEFFSQHDRTLQILPPDSKTSYRTTGRKLLTVPIDAPIIVSEILHNLRSALDYMVYELACENFPGVDHPRTQFVINDSKHDRKRTKGRSIHGFDSEIKRRFQGSLLPHQIDALENLQPYKGVTWTKTLRDLSNPDKHIKLTAVGGEWHGSVVVEGGNPDSFKGRTGEIFPGAGIKGADVYVEREYSVSIEFEDRTPVLKTLEIMKREVRATIDAFKPEFK